MIKKIKDKLLELGSAPKRSLGQNFLVNETKINLIVDCVKRSPIKNVIEIGPGLGSLTEKLMALEGKKLTLIELDKSFSENWRQKNLNVIEQDALQYDWSQVNEDTLVVSNLPYQISARITIDLSFHLNIKTMIFMYQKEVAQRIQSDIDTKDFGLISAFVQNYWDISKLLDAGAGDFYPKPNVGSRVLLFKRKNLHQPEPGFLNFLKLAFHQRRKMLIKNISSYPESDVKPAFAKLGISEQARAENVSAEDFLKLYSLLMNAK